jgi:hypothetical protein
MKASKPRIIEFLVLFWTAITTASALFYLLMSINVPEHPARLGLGLWEGKGRAAIFASSFIAVGE